MPDLVTVLIVVVVLLLFLAAFLLTRTVLFGKRIEPVEPVEGMLVDSPVIAEHLAKVVRCATISHLDPAQIDPKPFENLHRALEAMYPRVHATLERRVINDFGMLYTWRGRKADLDPVLFAGHIDVVPVEEAGLHEWTYPPFSGQIADGYVWGRGTLDMKSHVISLFEAVENLLKEGYRPQRSVLLAIGHDEEIGGKRGAESIAALLAEEGVHLEAVLDEGGVIFNEFLPGIKSPVALLATSEKGYLSLEFKVEGQPGHSSMPGPHTAIGILSAGLARLEASPMPARLHALSATMEAVGAVLPFGMQMLFANKWLFGGVLKNRLAANPKTNAAIRTTQAITMISGGVKDNLLPREARAVVNFRLLPGDSVAKVCTHVRRVVADDRVQFEPLWGMDVREGSPVTPTSAPAYLELNKALRQVFPGVVSAPFLMLGATDARYYTGLSENVFRFSPMQLTSEQLDLVHGTNERIAVESLGKMVQFFGQVIRAWGERKES